VEQHYQRNLLAAQGYCELKMYDDALAEVAVLPAEVQGEAMVVEMRLVILMQACRWDEALGISLTLCKLRPQQASGYIHAAFCLHERGDTAGAKRMLLHGPPALREEANFFYNLACYECVLGNRAEAERLLLQSCQMDAKYKEFARSDPDLRALREPSTEGQGKHEP
jgi:predicted Zn-dependent protease